MDWLTDNILFYCGIGAASAAAAAALICICVFRIRRAKLGARLDAEYGQRPEQKKK